MSPMVKQHVPSLRLRAQESARAARRGQRSRAAVTPMRKPGSINNSGLDVAYFAAGWVSGAASDFFGLFSSRSLTCFF